MDNAGEWIIGESSGDECGGGLGVAGWGEEYYFHLLGSLRVRR